MNDIETHLTALQKGDLKLKKLIEQIDESLAKSPEIAKQLLKKIDAFYNQYGLEDNSYLDLRRQINNFRRAHAQLTETQKSSDENITVFAGNTNSPTLDADDTPTQILDKNSDEDTLTPTKDETGSLIVELDKTVDISDLLSIGTDHLDLTKKDGGNSSTIGVGSVIKQRFKLLEVLGVGGMGKVYKGVDLLKEEARDKNPYCAVKLLNEDFKEHPESFIALQRESSRQQRLAHPNIATVYDFDRLGGRGTPVYITMEFMDGQPLNEYIKKELRKNGGLPFEVAYPMIKDMGAALIYAHEHGIVHSDFKPGNAFLLRTGEVKVLDFGIARAVKNPVTGKAEQTLFDPGKLGALTPTYASLEMLEGKEPDPRDDIYALGCTSYELLTGKHPFNKLPANKSKGNKLSPPYIKTLNKKQNRALQRAVAFERETRSQNVAEFLEQLQGKAIWHKTPFAIAMWILLAIAMILINPALDKLHDIKIAETIDDFKQGGYDEIMQKLDEIRIYDEVDQVRITQEAKDNIEKYFAEKLARITNASNDLYDFQQADMVLQEITMIYPDSIFLQKQNDLVSFRKKSLLSDLNKQYIAATKDKTMVGNINAILKNIAKIDPSHPLLNDPRASTAFRSLAEEISVRGDIEEALTIVNSGLEATPLDERLIDLQDMLQNTLAIRAAEAELSTLQEQLANQADNMTEKTVEFGDLNHYKQAEADIRKLYELQPANALLTELSRLAKPLAEKKLAAIINKGQRAEANAFLAEYKTLFEILSLNPILTKAKLANLSVAERMQTIQILEQQNIQSIEQALRMPNIGHIQWEAALLGNISELNTLATEDKNNTQIQATITDLRQRISELYIAAANTLLEKQRFDSADSLVSRGEQFAPQAMLAIKKDISLAKQEAARNERIQTNKLDLISFADANNVSEAKRIFLELRDYMPTDNIYITTEAPAIIAASFLRLAKSRAEQGDFAAAHKLANESISFAPNDITLSNISSQYEAEENISTLLNTFRTANGVPRDAGVKINQIEAYSQPGRSAEFIREASDVLAKRINSLRQTNETAAASMALNATRLFPSSRELSRLKDELQLKPWGQYSSANALLSVGKLTAAQKLRSAAEDQYGIHPQFIALSDALEKKIADADSIFALYQQDQQKAGTDYDLLRRAKILLDKARSRWVDNPEYATANEELTNLIQQNRPIITPRIRTLEGDLDLGAGTTVGGSSEIAEPPWSPITSEQECSKHLAGYGKRAKAICFDMIHKKARGPYMVVVPTNDDFPNGFAIGKYEISISDWSKYCILSNTCEPIQNKERKNEALTNISIAQIDAYTKWLSERTGKTYRLPTHAEWEYAARANGKSTNKDYNCRIMQGDNIIKGAGKVSIRSGNSNSWGLKNYIGNVQELVVQKNGRFMAYGGSYFDPHTKCDISLSHPYNRNGDEVSGFRLLLEEVN